MRKALILVPILFLCSCGFGDFITGNREAIGEGLGATSGLTGGVPLLKWIFLSLVGGGVGVGVHRSLKEK